MSESEALEQLEPKKCKLADASCKIEDNQPIQSSQTSGMPASPPGSKTVQSTFTIASPPKVSAAEQEELDLQLARVFASANLPFSLCNNRHFQCCCEMMRGPSYKCPDRHKMSDVILPQLCKESQVDFGDRITGKNVTLAMDGWSTVRNDPTLGFGLVCKNQFWLLDMLDTSGDIQSLRWSPL